MNFFPLIDLVDVNVFLWLSPSDPGWISQYKPRPEDRIQNI